MKSFNIFKLAVYFFLFVFIGCNSVKPNATKTTVKSTPEKPNIIIILADDLGYSDVGFNGSKDIITPNLDALAQKGTIFTSAYVSHPFCGPSRTSLMTGRYAHKIGAQFNLPPNSETIGEGISLNETFISKVLHNAGYQTGVMGKWHLGAVEKYHPNNRGFDDFYGFLGGGHSYFPKEYRAKYEAQKKNGKQVIFEYFLPLEHNGKEVIETEYITDALTREGSRFITEAAKKKDPFFLYLSYNAPHTPLEAKEDDMKHFQSIKDEKRRTYAGMVYAMDRGVGKIVETLKATGKYNNTLIVFLSDNGGKTSAGATNSPLKEGKGSTYEGGFRVPMFFHWPNIVPSGKTFNHPIMAIDFYPTFARLAGAKIPEGKILDGKNIWDDFLAGKNAHINDDIFVMRHRNGFTDVAVRKNQWKALKIYQQKWKLFNIEQDISETSDLSKQHPDILKNLVNDAENWSKTNIQPRWWHDKKTGVEWKKDNMPKFNQTFKLN
ncbi:sulfatase-like hydrolase/transferase [Lutibacter citreus]|uniref:sulfatase-like hydrolase/transferase n=1 Tax=Lutibacter citreus TaxID=2138210 RepID=UPI000DBE13D8|nr:sulfatase-like hydrolase/transferase [Lutibacter citreus]